MRIIVSLLHHFRMTPDGTVYPYSVFDYTFWSRYLEVFDEVVVFARVQKIAEINPATMPAPSSGPGVTFVQLPEFLGPWQYLRIYPRIKAMAKQLLKEDDACVLRVPGYLSTMLWRQLRKTKRPYAVEVVGDPWQAFTPGTTKSFLRPLIRVKFTREMTLQCRHASAAAYVTEKEIQKRYPPGNWSTHYSSIELSPQDIIDQDAVQKRIEKIEQKSKTKDPWRLCFVGSLWHLVKSPDVVIQAVADCLRRGCRLQLTLVGDGSLRPQLEEQTRRLNLTENVEFLGHLPPGKAINEQLDRADVFLLPSRSEGLPRSIIEAFARGLPCIGGNVGGFLELLEKRYQVDPEKKNALADTIINTITHPEAMKQAVVRNVKKAQEYRSDVLKKRRTELYTRLRNVTRQWYDSQYSP